MSSVTVTSVGIPVAVGAVLVIATPKIILSIKVCNCVPSLAAIVKLVTFVQLSVTAEPETWSAADCCTVEFPDPSFTDISTTLL